MKYYRINLNKLEDPRLAKKKARREFVIYCLLLLGCIALLAAMATYNSKLNIKRRQFLKLRDKIETEIKILEQSEDFVSEAEVRELSRLNMKRMFWTGKLESLSKLTGDAISITRIKFNGKKLLIAGITKFTHKKNHFADVSAFIKKLQAEPAFKKDFDRILFESSNRIKFDNQEIVHFEIICHKGESG